MVKISRLRSLLLPWKKPRSSITLRRKTRGLQHRRSVMPWILAVVIGFACLWSGVLSSVEPSRAAIPEGAKPTDVTPQGLQLAEETYLNRCATCHIALPPAVLATETWKDIITDTAHYNAPSWTPLRNPDLALTWKYLQSGSRPLNPNEQKTYRIARSRYFKILHPRVQFKEPATLSTCVSCHAGAQKFNYRDLTPEWQDAP
jgi:mono/diheme cytochrome c family protein